MLTQSKEVQNAWRASQRTLDIKVTIDGKTYGATDVNSLKYDSGAYSGDTFAIGSTYSNTVQIEFSHLIEGLKLGMEVRPSIGIKTSSGYVYEPLGVFIISSEIKMDRNNNLTTVSASDRFCGLEGTYVSKLTYPAKVLDVIAEICAQSGVKANTDDLARLPHQADLSAPITGQSYRKALGWIAQLYVGYALFDRQGLFTIRTISEPNYELDPSQYEQAGLTKNEAAYKINGIQCQVTLTTKTRDGESTEETKNYQAGDATGSQIKLENNIMTPQRLNDIWEQLKDITFYPFSLNWFGNPAVEAGDWLRLEDKQGNSFVVPNSSYTLDFNGGLSATSKADQTTSSDQMVPWQGSVAQTIKELQLRRLPDGTVVFPPSVTAPPTNAKFNDVWFKKNGNSTELWIFEKQDDGSGKWIRKDLSDDEIKKKVTEAQQGLNQAKADIINNKQKADTDIENLNKSIEANKKVADQDIQNLNKSIEANKKVADQDIQNLNKSIEDNKKVADESLQKLNDSVTNLQGQYDNNVVPNLNKVMADASDALQKYITAQNSIADLTKQAQQQGKDIADVTNTVKRLNVNYANLAGDVSSTKVDVKGLQTTVGTANGDIAQLKLDAQNLQTMLAGKVDNTTYTNFVNLTNQALNARLTASDLNGYAKTADVQATANGLRVDLNSVTDRMNNLKVGGRNLVASTDREYTMGFGIPNTVWQDGYAYLKLPITLTASEIEILPQDPHTFYYSLTPGQEYTQTVWFETDATVKDLSVAQITWFTNAGHDYQPATLIKLGENKYKLHSTYTWPGKSDNNVRLFDTRNLDGAFNLSTGTYLKFGKLKLEEGNVSTDWSPAVEDTAHDLEQLSARITTTSQQFSSYYTKAETDNRTNSAKSDAVNAIKSDSNWQGLSNILTNSGFLQTADGFLQKVQQTTIPMFNGGGVNLVKDTSESEISGKAYDIKDYYFSEPLEPNTKYTISIDAKVDQEALNHQQFIFVDPYTADWSWGAHMSCISASLEYQHYRYTFITPDASQKVTNISVYLAHPDGATNGDRDNLSGTGYFKKLKVERGEIDTPYSHAPSDNVSLSAFSELSQSLEGLRSTVSGNYGQLQNTINQTNQATRNEIIDKVAGLQNQITTTANGLNAKIGAIQVGGRNLLIGTCEEEVSGKSYDFKGYQVSGGLQPNTTYTLSGWARVDQSSMNHHQNVFVDAYSEDWSWSVTLNISSSLTSQYNKITFTTPSGKQFHPYVTVYLSRPDGATNGDRDNLSGTAFIKKLKLEEGNIATDYTHAPEDTDQAFTEVNATIKGLQSTVSNNHGELQSQISQTATTIRGELTNNVTGLQNQITANASGITALIQGNPVSLIRKGSFEDGSKGMWDNSATIVDVNNNNVPFTKALCISKRDSYEEKRINVTPGDHYLVKAWIKSDEAQNNRVSVGLFLIKKDGKVDWINGAITVNHDWELVTGEITIPNDVVAAEGWIQIDAAQNFGHAYLADISITKISDKTMQVAATLDGLQSTVSNNYGNLQSQISQSSSTLRTELTDKIKGIDNKTTSTADSLNSVIGRVGSLENLTNFQVINNAINANDYTNTGNYFIQSTANTNVPGTDWCYLKVERVNDGRIVQTWQADIDPTLRYVRTKFGDSWTQWQRSASYSEYSELNRTVQGLQSTVSNNHGELQSQISQTAKTIRQEVSDKTNGLQTQINQQGNNFNVSLNSLRKETAWQKVTSAIDANNYKTTGNYWIQAAPNSNTPDSSAWAYFQVVAYSDAKRIKQTWQRDNNENDIYTRLLIGDNWTSWQRTVTGGNIMAQINMSAGTTLIQNDKIYMDASSTVFSGKAFIPSAAITELNADKITAGTINGAKVNVINLNANNITAGTLKGSNGEFYLDSGALHVWQGDHNAWIDKNGIHDSDNSGNNVWISNGSISAYGNSSGAYLFDGGLYLHKSQSLSDAVLNPNYGSITKSDNIVSFGTSGLDIDGKDGFLLRTHGWNDQTLAYLNGNEIIGAGIAGKSDGFMNIAAKKQLFLYAGEPVQNDKLKTIPKLVLDGTYQNGQTALKGTFSQYFFQGPSSGFSGGITLQDEFVNVGSLNGKNYFSISSDGAISITANGKSILSLNGLFPGVNGDFNVSGNFTVTGSKNAIVPTSRGMAAINAYETAEYYFGDIGETQTNSNGVVTVMIDPYFLETVNTLVPYQVFLTSYGDGNVWVSSRSANNFTVKSSNPNIHFAWEIKAKRKGYENDRMKIVKGVFNNEQY